MAEEQKLQLVTTKMAKSTTAVAGMTLLSRIMGFLRDVIIAHLFGATAQIDAFWVAFKIPNFLRRLFAEGAFSQAFVPVLSEYKHTKTPDETMVFLQYMAGSLIMALAAVTAIAIVITPLIVMVFAPGFIHDPMRFGLVSDLLRITFPYIFFISLTAFAGGILNANSLFWGPAFTPVLLNAAIISCAVMLSPHLEQPVTALAVGVFIGGVVQLLFQIPFLKQLKLLPKPKFNWHDQGVRQVLKLMVPALFGVSVAQVNLLLDTLFASFLPAGSVSWLYYSDRLTGFPLGVFAVAMATVVLPHLSKHHASQSMEKFTATLDWSLRIMLLGSLPAGIGLLLLAGPILVTLFQYGAFNPHDAIMAQRSLWMFSLGVPAFMLIKVLVAGFYARQDMRTPVKIGVVAMCSNIIMNLLLIKPMAHAGLALATTLAAYLNGGLLMLTLYKRQLFKPTRGWVKLLAQLIFSLSMMVAFLLYFSPSLLTWLEWGWRQRASHIAFLVLGAMIAYFGSLIIAGLRIRDLKYS